MNLAEPRPSVAIFWFRRDLRLNDNAGLSAALGGGLPVLPIFIFDTHILSRLKDRSDKRVEFIHRAISNLQLALAELGSSMRIEQGDPKAVFKKLVKEFEVKTVYTNRDYEPYAIKRDEEVKKYLTDNGIEFLDFKDQVIFEKTEVAKDDGKPYTVFTPFSRKWKARLAEKDLKPYKTNRENFFKCKPFLFPDLAALGFKSSKYDFPKAEIDLPLIKAYNEHRNTPSVAGTSRLGIHLRFGTVSIRELVRAAKKTSETWLNELIWREFFMQILWSFPHAIDGPFRPEYAKVSYRNDKDEFKLWCEGKTGYPIVDAGMRELNATGFMHNRVRMIAASLLVKHLLIDWRWGEAYFAEKLLDFELASNNGNWQWVAGCGCDAAPYFRVFNPEIQAKKFDAKSVYIKKWVPEFGTAKQLEPIVSHTDGRLRALRAYAKGLGKKAPEPTSERT